MGVIVRTRYTDGNNGWLDVAISLAFRVVVVLVLWALLLGCLGCNDKFIDVAHPTPERMQELLNQPVNVKAKAMKFEMQLSPAVILAGRSVRVLCFVPGALNAYKIRLGIPGLGMHEGSLFSAEASYFIEHVPCGDYVATCDILTPSGQQHREAPLTAKGECNSGTAPAEKGQR